MALVTTTRNGTARMSDVELTYWIDEGETEKLTVIVPEQYEDYISEYMSSFVLAYKNWRD